MRFAIGLRQQNQLVGVVICGRPVSRGTDWRTTLEVLRLCTDGTTNACSMLYGAAARAAKALGYAEIQTYTLERELGASLRAAGFIEDGLTKGGRWNHSTAKQLLLGGGTRRGDQPDDPKRRWVRKIR